ncbi:MAG: ABC transporter ATP-binding protein [Deltaproteobacteria bacterium]|nr:ABC transporter ATP-binding protein [Deltaproteobacteria bacterium]
MLEIDGVSFSYGGVRALEDVSLAVAPGEVVSLLGMNGAGKTTLLNIVSGLLRPGRGRVVLGGQDATGWRPQRVVAQGVVQVPEGRQVFAPLTVEENLELGAYLRLRKRQAAQVARDKARVLELFPALAPRLAQPAGTLSGGEQQMLAIGRGLMAHPNLLLLDEPSLGLAPLLAAEILAVIRRLAADGVAVLLVEQNALGALSVSQRGYIITGGRIRFSGAAQDILGDQLLREAFLGPQRAKGAGEQTAE